VHTLVHILLVFAHNCWLCVPRCYHHHNPHKLWKELHTAT